MAFPSPFKRVRALIGQDRTLAVLLPEAARLRELNGRLAQALPPAVARACQVAALNGGEALIYCGNGAAASRVRGQAASLARALAVDSVKVRMRADWARPDRPAKAGLGQGALKAWDELEHELPEGDLKQAIDRLLDHHRRR
jgi:hypothetical protein